MKILLKGCAVLAFTLISASARAQDGIRDRVDTTVTLDRGGTLSVSLYAGRVNVVGVSGSRVRVQGVADRGEMEIRSRSGAVSVSMQHGGSHRGNASLDISVPIGTRVVLEGFSVPFEVRGVKGEAKVESLSGSVVVNDAVGKVTVETVSGSILVTGVEGDVTAESVSGRVALSDIDGDIETESVSGRIELNRVKAKSVRAETVGASVSYDGSIDPTGNYVFRTHSGRLTLALPVNAGATVSLETFSGNVDSDFPVTLESGNTRKGHESRFEFRIGSGRSRIVAETFSGNIRIQRGTSRDNEE